MLSLDHLGEMPPRLLMADQVWVVLPRHRPACKTLYQSMESWTTRCDGKDHSYRSKLAESGCETFARPSTACATLCG